MSYFNTVSGAGATQQKLINGPKLSVERKGVYLLLNELAAENRAYFDGQRAKSAYYARISDCCAEIIALSDLLEELIIRIQEIAITCDYDEKTPGNGWRSLSCVSDMIVLNLISTLKLCSGTRARVFFRSNTICKEIENEVAIVRWFVLAFQQVVLLNEQLDEGALFPSLKGDYSVYHGLLKGIESLDACCFYGRGFGFQFTPSVTLIFNLIGIVLATYSLGWGSSKISSLFSSSRFILNPEERAKQIIKVTREADIDFCRAFWNLSELPPPKLFCAAIDFFAIMHVPLCGPLELRAKNGNTQLIPEPNAHGPPKPVQIRVLSATNRQGLSPNSDKPLSANLILHCHGGGYVATTSKSHETYLRIWAKDLDCPIVSVDYSLSPEFPFPRPTEEVCYVYAWLLNNPEKLGWNGKKIIFVGDSAGGNLIVSVALRLAELGVTRMPDALIPIYTPFLFQYLPSPSRVLSFTDPLLHMGLIIRCAAAYTGVCPRGTAAEATRKSSASAKPTLMQYVDQIKAKQLVNASDYSFGSSSILSLVNLSKMGAPSTSLDAAAVAEQQARAAAAVDGPAAEEVATKKAALDKEALAEAAQNLDADDAHSPSFEDDDEYETPPSSAKRDEDTATVHIDFNSAYISLSACNYDQSLIKYLKEHPLTSASAQLESPAEASRPLSKTLVDESQPISGGRMSRSGSTSDEKHIDQLFDRKPSLSTSVVRTVTTNVGSAFDKITHYIEPQSAPIGSADRAKLTRAMTDGYAEAARTTQKEAEKIENSLTELLKLNLSRDHLISPLYASDELLAQLPPCRFISCHLDPLLDDTVAFAKRLRAAGGRVESIDFLDGLSHGFLNFAPLSEDCYEGARMCMFRIREAFEQDSTNA